MKHRYPADSVPRTGEFDATLRDIRTELAPQIPDMSRALTRNPHILESHVNRALAGRGIDPAEVPPLDINKTARHAMAAHMIGRTADCLVEGSGAESRFRILTPDPLPITRWPAVYEIALKRTIELAPSMIVAEARQNGASRSWWPGLERAYLQLGREGIALGRKDMPLEATELKRAARSSTFAAELPSYLNFIRRSLPDSDTHEERMQAAHGNAHIVTGLAARHLRELRQRAREPYSEFLELCANPHSGDYRATPVNRAAMRAFYPALPAAALPDARLKCPALAPFQPIAGDEAGCLLPLAVTPEDATTSAKQKSLLPDSPLARLIHASVNAAGAHGII